MRAAGVELEREGCFLASGVTGRNKEASCFLMLVFLLLLFLSGITGVGLGAGSWQELGRVESELVPGSGSP